MQYYLRLSIIYFLLSLTSVLAQTSSLSNEKLEDFGRFIEEEIHQQNIAGAEVYIVQDTKPLWHKTYGVANMDTQKPLQKNSIYYIQSMTKPIISTAIMQLVEQGKLNLEDKVEKYIPEVAELRVTTNPEEGIEGSTVARDGDITLAQLLNHTAGLSHGLGETKLDKQLFESLYNETLNYKGHTKLESRVTALLKAPLIGQPGKQWYYSAGPDLLALILQRIAKQSVPDYLKEHIFDPAGMKDTGYNLNSEQAERVMPLHTYNKEGKFTLSELQVPTEGNTVYGGTHGLFSTVEDYAQFCQIFLNWGEINGAQILKEETVRNMLTNSTGKLMGESRGFGLGFGVLYNTEKDPSPAANGQFYWGGYFRTHFFVDPSEKLIALFMTQKLPYGEDYNRALSQYIYAAMEQ